MRDIVILCLLNFYVSSQLHQEECTKFVSIYKVIHHQNRNVKVIIQADKYMRIHRTSNMQDEARNVNSTREAIYCNVSDVLQRIQGLVLRHKKC